MKTLEIEGEEIRDLELEVEETIEETIEDIIVAAKELVRIVHLTTPFSNLA